MKKAVCLFFLFLTIQNLGFSQNATWMNKAKQRLAEAKNDTTRIKILLKLSNAFKFNKPDSAMYFATKAISLSQKIGYPLGEAMAMQHIVLTQQNLGNDALALKINLQALKLARENNLIYEQAYQLLLLGHGRRISKNYETALRYYLESLKLFDSIHDVTFSILAQSFIGLTYLGLNQLDSAMYYGQLANDNPSGARWVYIYTPYSLGEIYKKTGNYNLAVEFYKKSLSRASSATPMFNGNLGIAKVYKEINNSDSCYHYAQKALDIATESGFLKNAVDANVLLSEIFEQSNPGKALQYSKTAIAYKDSLDDIRNKTATESFIDFDEQQKQFELEKARNEYQYRLRRNAFLGSTFTLIVIAVFLYILFRRKQKAKQKIESAYDQLKSTQAQLIQSEKMASLGELTAGIAHEIQNPLNFVNNFSEVSEELVTELKEELEKGEVEEAKEISNDVIENLNKIKHHGQRASGIVKGMLEHSRTGDGVKEPTDINALADEYLRLAYHGLRAKNKTFDADFKTEFDESLPIVNVVPQDIGRVLLNLINNAFYAVNKKAKEGIEGYQPNVSVSTKKYKSPSGDLGVEISVQDNGPGIPEDIKEKIFQPFFTTKPTGSGTGLGLSLSYDIVKAHGGEIEVTSEERKGTEFVIQLPNV